MSKVKTDILPLVPLPGKLPQPSSWTDIALSVAITVIPIAVALYLAKKWFQKERDFDQEVVGETFEKIVFPRIKRLENQAAWVEKQAASVASVEQRSKTIEGEIAELRAHIPIPPPPAGSIAALSRTLMLKELRRPGIGSVGQFTNDDVKP